MICIFRMKDGQPVGWIIAENIEDARRQARDISLEPATSHRWPMTTPKAGKYKLDEGQSPGEDLWMLVT